MKLNCINQLLSDTILCSFQVLFHYLPILFFSFLWIKIAFASDFWIGWYWVETAEEVAIIAKFFFFLISITYFVILIWNESLIPNFVLKIKIWCYSLIQIFAELLEYFVWIFRIITNFEFSENRSFEVFQFKLIFSTDILFKGTKF